MQVSIKAPDLRTALRRLDRASGETKAGIKRALFRIGATVRRTAKAYAPEGPSKEMHDRLLKSGGAGAQAWSRGTKTRSAQLVTQTESYAGQKWKEPGGLKSSINFASDASKAEVFVPLNSDGGKYARKMHDDKGLSWWNRGPGTQAKGAQADDKFILRAIQDEEPTLLKIIDQEMEKVT